MLERRNEKRLLDRLRALRESEKRFRGLINSVGDGVVVTDAEQRFTLANPAAGEILGLLAKGLVGRTLGEFPRLLGSTGALWTHGCRGLDLLSAF
jgi:PAS domain-containing protein